MISNLESIGGYTTPTTNMTEPIPVPTADDLGANLLIASSPRRPAPVALHDRLLSRIAAEPASVTTDVHGRITAINPAFSGLCGYAFTEMRGQKPGTFLQGERTDPAAVDIIRQAVRSGSSCTTDLTNYHKNGTAYRVRIAVEPLRDASGNLTGFRATETQLP